MKSNDKAKNWSTSPENKISLTKRALSYLSLRVRAKQLELFFSLLKPSKKSTVLDVGVNPNERLPDSNFFEKKYPYHQNLTTVSVEDCQKLFKKKYPKVKFIEVEPNERLPFSNKSFDIVCSWATLEHVGKREKQEFFLRELFRIGKKVFITTPDKKCFYEPHSGLFFVHWLPRKWFEKICHFLGKSFWASENNLRCLWKKEVEELLPEFKKTKILTYKIFGIIPSHLMIIKT